LKDAKHLLLNSSEANTGEVEGFSQLRDRYLGLEKNEKVQRLRELKAR